MQVFIEEAQDSHRHATGAGGIAWDNPGPDQLDFSSWSRRTTKTPGRCTRRTSRPRTCAWWSPRMWCLRR